MKNRLGLHEDPYTVRRHLLIALGVIAIAIYLFIPKVQHFTYDPGTGKAYRQWTYGTVDVVEPGS